MKEQDLFNFPEVHIDKPIRLIELFGGRGAFFNDSYRNLKKICGIFKGDKNDN